LKKRRKLFELEKNVLPKSPKPAKMYIEDKLEIELSKKANQIREKISVDLIDVWNSNKLTLEEKQNITFKTYNELDEQEMEIVSKDTDFSVRRLQDILINYYKLIFPKNCIEPFFRVVWFFNEMDKLAFTKFMEDSEWYHNRDEDNPDFDDIAWWNRVDLKIKELYPEGIFTEGSWNKTHELYDKIQSEYMVQYWKDHPEEFEKITIKHKPIN
jgi:hypothetical protein